MTDAQKDALNFVAADWAPDWATYTGGAGTPPPRASTYRFLLRRGLIVGPSVQPKRGPRPAVRRG